MSNQPDRVSNDPFGSIDLSEISPLPPPPLVRFEGWRTFVEATPPVRPLMPSLAVFHAMTKKEKGKFATDRKRYHGKFGPIETPALSRIHEEALRLAALNYVSAPGARPGIVLDGEGTLGKSTISVELGKKYEKSLRKKLMRPIDAKLGSDFIPVVYVTLPGELTIRAFNRLIAQFLGIPGAANGDVEWLNERIIKTADECGVSLVIIDDIHFLKMKNRSAESVNNHFKYLASSISATFIYAGIHVEDTGLFSESSSKDREKFSQTRHRFKKYTISPFQKGSEDFLNLLLAFEKNLLLLLQPEKSILTLADYIHDRTDGYIGAISNLMREGANSAIQAGDERLSEKVLNRIRLDHAAEQHRRIVRPARPASGTSQAVKTGRATSKNGDPLGPGTLIADPASATSDTAATQGQ
ncbi:TniB family NTP-binding protein [Noviherbaspirillum sp. 1P10PC]|uniref:TniB family NTP-binding protein n=1 Tax=Noviherbaspirillum sp. 1P10PC TaxID=3132292 RepID=UPI0039A16A45